MLTEPQSLILATYADLMTEVKSRLSWIAYVVAGQSGLDPVLAREFCYLQIRMICETIALCALVAHGEFEEVQAPKFQKMWSAPEILNVLEKLNPSFYPTPQVVEPNGPGAWNFADIETEYLTKSGLMELYGKSGDQLHRGSLRNILSGKKTLEIELQTISDSFKAITRLLDVHRIALVSESVQFVCLMDGGEGKVKTLLAEAF